MKSDSLRTQVSSLGSLYLERRSTKGARVMLAAHLHAVGLIVSHVDRSGLAWLHPAGELQAAECSGAELRFAHGALAVLGCASTSSPAEQPPRLLADFGARLPAPPVRTGSMGVFATPWQVERGLVRGKALDRRVGVALALHAARRTWKAAHSLVLALTTLGQVGQRAARAAADTGDAQDLVIDTFLNYDLLDERGDTPERLSLAELRAIPGGTADTADEGDIPKAVNFAQFNFLLSEVGTDADSDTVDYSQTDDSIVAVVNFNPDDDVQYVMIDTDGPAGDTFDDVDDEDEDRVDLLDSVENIVASQSESIVEVTNSNMDLAITFSREITAVGPNNVHRVQLSNLNTDEVFGMNHDEHAAASRPPRNQHGIAVLLVLACLAIIAPITASFNYRRASTGRRR